MKRIQYMGIGIECKVTINSDQKLEEEFWKDLREYLETLKKEYSEFVLKSMMVKIEDWIGEKYGPIKKQALQGVRPT